MLNVALASSFARNAIVGAVVSKVIDTFIMSKINHRLEEKKWIRNKKLELYSQFSEEALEINSNNFQEKKQKIKKLTAKIMLIEDNKKLVKKIHSYLDSLHNRNSYSNHIDDLNITLIQQFSKNLK